MELVNTDFALNLQRIDADGVRTSDASRLRLKILLDYELAAALRYRRFASVVLITTQNKDLRLIQLLEDAIRDSDEIFEIDSSTIILMGDTDKSGAITAVERILEQYKSDLLLKFAVACYPGDGNDSTELLLNAFRRLGVKNSH